MFFTKTWFNQEMDVGIKLFLLDRIYVQSKQIEKIYAGEYLLDSFLLITITSITSRTPYLGSHSIERRGVRRLSHFT